MTKDVLVSVAGLQFEVDQDAPIEVITTGEYYFKNQKHFVLYEEILDGYSEVTKNTVKVSDKQVEIMKKGSSNVHMIFEENKKNMTYYNTPFGELLIGIHTTLIDVKEEEDNIQIKIEYILDVNYNYISNCEITIHIKAKGEK
ncbi:DUF1934 domain-containing protein [Anaeromicropila herbilytica]|uniref:DUF1934 domain-containing protein n=1 Tax=Anaeromicropila herbilytica TaxID=2785025 RepID=A0A7R7IAU1_9FIRM|nr:DUF1934 domain-containing protein [Anaeromicropila herbilytica]BCN28818.1 hypothetical protein bsdtb5_01130 [Anaeromicropila herbilytica]